MRHHLPLISLFYLLLLFALVLASVHQAQETPATSLSTPWLPPQLTPDPGVTTRTPGWWDEIPTAVPFPSLTPRK
jgi:hypothetical protein